MTASHIAKWAIVVTKGYRGRASMTSWSLATIAGCMAGTGQRAQTSKPTRCMYHAIGTSRHTFGKSNQSNLIIEEDKKKIIIKEKEEEEEDKKIEENIINNRRVKRL